MTLNAMMSLSELVDKARATDDVDFLRDSVAWLVQRIMDEELTAQVGAGPYERNTERLTHRNGYRRRELNSRVGTFEVAIPKLRQGSYFPDWLIERWRPSEKALMAVIMEAYIRGVSTRKMAGLVKELGVEGMDKSAVSRITKGLDERVGAFRNRPLDGAYPYLWLDATFIKVREGGRVVNMALVMAVGVRDSGEREILGFELGGNEDGAFWREFLRGMVARGLGGVKLVISDAHQGLRDAIAGVFSGACWQRCRVHFTRNVLSHIPKAAQEEVADQVRTIFAQPTHQAALEQVDRVLETLSSSHPRAAEILEQAAEDILAHMHFPRSHWRRLHSTNPLERLNKEVKRRFHVVGIFPDRAAAIRLGGAVLLEQHEEWLAGRRYFSTSSMEAILPDTAIDPATAAAAG